MNIAEEYKDRLAEPSDMQGHMEFLRETAAGYRDPVIIELGVRNGKSTASFLAGIAAPGGHLWSVDVNDPVVPEEWHSLVYWHFLKADDRSEEARAWLPESCDILFIDTDHTLKGTLRELELYVPRVRPGGIVLMHDTELESDTEPSRFYVAEALRIFWAATGLAWENRPGSYGLGVIRIPRKEGN